MTLNSQPTPGQAKRRRVWILIATVLLVVTIGALVWESRRTPEGPGNGPGPDPTTPGEPPNQAEHDSLWETVATSVPDRIKDLREIDLKDEIRRDDARIEYRQLVRKVEDNEKLQIPAAPAQSGSAPARMFSPVARRTFNGKTSVQEMDTDLVSAAGPQQEVLLHNGELRIRQVDYSLPSRSGLGFTFARIYRSHIQYDGPLGHGWDHNHNQRLVADGPSLEQSQHLDWFTGERRIRFERKGDQWRAEQGAFYRLTKTGTSIQIETPTLNRLVFRLAVEKREGSVLYRIHQITTRHDDGKANRLVYSYHAQSDLLVRMTDPFGNPVDFYYDDAGRLVELRHSRHIIQYRYDATGLVGVEIPLVALSIGDDPGSTIGHRFRYVAENAPPGMLQTLTPPGGRFRFQYQHDTKSGRVTEVQMLGNPPNAPAGVTWKFETDRDEQDQSLRVSVQPPSPAPRAVHLFPAEDVASGVSSTLSLARMVPAREATWRYQYNRDGQVVSEEQPLGAQAEWGYDADNEEDLFRGNLLEMNRTRRQDFSSPGPDKITTSWKYHPQIALPVERTVSEETNGLRSDLESESFQYDDKLHLVKQTSGDQSMYYVRNRFGRVVVSVNGLGDTTLYKYYEVFSGGSDSLRNGGLQAVVVEDFDSKRLEGEFRRAGIKSVIELPKRQKSVPVVNRETRSYYNKTGIVIQQDHPGYKTYFLYNKLDMLLAQYDSRVDLQVWEYDKSLARVSDSRRVTTVADSPYRGELIPGLEGYFYQQRFVYDDLGRRLRWIQTKERDGDRGLPTVRYEYYANGTLKSRKTSAGPRVQFTYESNTGYLSEKSLASADAPGKQLVLQTDFTYDAEGFLTSYKDDRGKQHRFGPDGFGRSFFYRGPDGVEQRDFLDGLDRTIRMEQRVVEGGRLLAESWRTYDRSGNLVKAEVHRLASNAKEDNREQINEQLIQGEYRYDVAGNLVESRSYRENAWTKYEYDGLNRQIRSVGPEGDSQETTYDRDHPVMRTSRFQHPGKKDDSVLRSVTLVDERDRPWLVVPVGTDEKPAYDRSTITTYDTLGRTVAVTRPGLTQQLTTFDSLDRVVNQRERPLVTRNGEKSKRFGFEYDADGRLLRQTLQNNPMVVFQDETLIKSRRVSVPQVTRYEYDAFGRLFRTTLPDGLVKSLSYTSGSMVEKIGWSHLSEPKFDREIHFTFDSMRRPVTIREGELPGKILQTFKYNVLGQLVVAEDRGNPEYPVKVTRAFDNLGNLLDERTTVSGKVIGASLHYQHDLQTGKQDLRLRGIEGQREDLWQQMTVSTDLVGRPVTIGLDENPTFCRYSYVGSQRVRKSLPDSRIDIEIDTSPLLEPVRYEFKDTAANKQLCHLDYELGKQGRVIASAFCFPQEDLEQAHFFHRDSFSQIIGEGGQQTVPDDLQERHKEVILDKDIVRFHQVLRYRYDEARNRIHEFHGAESEVDAGRTYSPGETVKVSLGAGRQEERDQDRIAQRHRDLASNRLGTIVDVRRLDEFHYNPFGRMTEYESDVKGRTFKWKLVYDILGRVIRMTGVSAGKNGQQEKRVTLSFATDVFNRRVIKRDDELEKEYATTYVNRNPLVVMDKGDGGAWSLSAQYLWGPGQREVLMALLPAGKVDPDPLAGTTWRRFYLHQDRMQNVFFCTGVKGETTQRVEVFDIASYLGFGENSTSVAFQNIEATNQRKDEKSKPKFAIDKRLDGQKAQFLASGKGRITLDIDGPRVMTKLTIWTDNFPDTFRVYVVPKGKDARPDTNKNKIDFWEQDHQKWLAATVKNGLYFDGFSLRQRKEDIMSPFRLVLQSKEGQHIVIIWDKASSFTVEEFELTVEPKHVSDLAFSGSWLDKETELYYQGSRYRMASKGGHFLSPDPLGFLDGANLYAYAHNDPLTWHDPDGEFAHVLIGAAVGGVLGGGVYALQALWSGEEFSLAKFAIYTGAGAASGALAAATFGAVSGLGAGLVADGLAGAAAGGAGGAANGFLASGGTTLLETGSLGQAATAGLQAAAVGGAMGIVGGGLGGMALGQLARGPMLNSIGNKSVRGLITSTVSGAMGGGGAGAVGGGYAGYQESGWSGVLSGAGTGAWKGAVVGGAGGALAFGVGKGIDKFKRATWGKAKAEFWRNEAQNPRSKWEPDQLARMRTGRPPQQMNPNTGKLESMELHHSTLPTRSGLPRSVIDRRWNLENLWPNEHAAVDPYRHMRR